MKYQRGIEFVRRMYLPRAVGLFLGGVAVATVLWANGAKPWVWVALVLACGVWPHVAFRVGMASPDPFAAERRNLMIDSMFGGAFIALMQFNLLPSALLMMMLSMDKLSVGGPRFLARCTLGLVAACFAAAAATGFQARLATTMPEIVASLPLLVVYPVAVGLATYSMAKRIRYQSQQLEALGGSGDALSRLPTRRAWEQAVAQEFELCGRTGLPASILLIDVDHLRDVNDTHGHPVGDEVIRSVAEVLRSSLREQDLVGRWSGEEFAVLMPGVGAARAEERANLAREAVAAAALERTGQVRRTVSIGIAEMNARGSGASEWIARAYEALNAAKLKGGNTTTRFQPIGVPSA